MTKEEKLAVEKLDSVQEQLSAFRFGQKNYIVCPYCETMVVDGTLFCCDTLRRAIHATLERQQVERIGNGIIN